MGCIQSRQVPMKTEFPDPPRPAEEVEREEAIAAIRQRAIDAVKEADRAAANERRMKEKALAAEKRALESAKAAERAREHAKRLKDPDFDPLYVERESDFSITPEPEKEPVQMSVRDKAAMFEGLASTGGGIDEKRAPRKLCMPDAFKSLETFEAEVENHVQPPPGMILFPDEKYVYDPKVRVHKQPFGAPTSPITPPTTTRRAPLVQQKFNEITHVNGVRAMNHEPDQDHKQRKDVKEQLKFNVIQKVAKPDFKDSTSSPLAPTAIIDMSSAVSSPMVPTPSVMDSPPMTQLASVLPVECSLVAPGEKTPETPSQKLDSVSSSPSVEVNSVSINTYSPTPNVPTKSAPLRENKASAAVLVTHSPRLNAKLAAYEALDAEARAGPPPPENLFNGEGRRVSGNLAKYEALDAAARAGPPPPETSFVSQGRRVSGNLAKYEALDAEARAGPPPAESLSVGQGWRVSGNLAKYEALDAQARAPLPPPADTDSSYQGYTVRQRLAWSDELEKSKDEYGDETNLGYHSLKQIERRQQKLFEQAGLRTVREKPVTEPVSARSVPPCGLGIMKHLSAYEHRDAVAARGIPAKIEAPLAQSRKVNRLSGMLAMYEERDRIAEEEERIQSTDRRMIVAAKTRASLSSS